VLLDLTEALACPRCGPPQGLIVLVERMEGRRLLEGRFDCPACEARYPFGGGTLDFRESGTDGDRGGRESVNSGADATMVAALLGLGEARGLIVLGPRLRPIAQQILQLSTGCEVLLLAGARSGAPSAPSFAGAGESGELAELQGVGPEAIPLLSSSALGVALDGGEGVSPSEAARVLAPGGRLVIVRPAPEMTEHALPTGLELIAGDARAVVARKK
jgi:hypothetical protein